ERTPTAKQVNGVRVMSTDAFLAAPRQTTFLNVALANPRARMTVCELFLESGFKPMPIISRTLSSWTLPKSARERLCAFCMITTNIRIGRFFHANIYSYVEHHPNIVDYVTFAPGSIATATSLSRILLTLRPLPLSLGFCLCSSAHRSTKHADTKDVDPTLDEVE